MATSKKPNVGTGELSSQDKSMQVKLEGDFKEVKSNEQIHQELQKFIPDNDHDKTFDFPERELVKHLKEDAAVITSRPKTMLDPKQIRGYMELKYDFNDITIVPKAQTNIRSRYGDIDILYKDIKRGSHLPLITAPMDTVVNHHNAHVFQHNYISVALPRTVNTSRTFSTFTSYGLKDVPQLGEHDNFVLLDVANGHMSAVLEWCVKVKHKYPHVEIMAGNIANPETYRQYCNSGVIDYARVGIGNGNGCLTTQQTGVGYPMASLIRECYEIKINHKNPVKIVADGGMKDYSDIIKALALGADYVMIGSIFSKALESAAPISWKGIRVGDKIGTIMYNLGFKMKKEFRGMSTKAAQKALGNNTLKTSEGVTRVYDVEYTLEQWVENFGSYLRSAISYSNANSLQNYIGKADTTLITNNAFNRFKK
jgi:IMP dehydrogenase/GMP reductase